SCRTALTGTTPLHGQLREIADSLHQLDMPLANASVSVERVLIDTRPAVDLAVLARANDAAGQLAQLILALGAGQPIDPQLSAAVQSSIVDVQAAPAYRNLGSEVDDETSPTAAAGADTTAGAEAVLRRGAMALLAELV